MWVLGVLGEEAHWMNSARMQVDDLGVTSDSDFASPAPVRAGLGIKLEELAEECGGIATGRMNRPSNADSCGEGGGAEEGGEARDVPFFVPTSLCRVFV